MGIMTDNERMVYLVDELNDMAFRYYVLDEPRVSDAEYDKLFDELLSLEKKLGYNFQDSPTQRIGGEPLKVFKQHHHIAPLFSLDKVRAEDDLRAWAKKVETIAWDNGIRGIKYSVEYKFDGLTINLTYDGGFLVQAATRGTGEIGEVILEQVKTVKEIPLSIPYKGRMEVQGEGYMKLSAMKAYNATAAEPIKNARNGVAGALRNSDPKETAKRRVSAFFYNIGHIDDWMSNQVSMIEFLRVNRIPTSQLFKVCDTIDQVIEEIKDIEKNRDKLDFLIDGAVVKVIDFQTRDILGYTNRFPRWAMAWKFEAEEISTVLNNIVWEVGRTGKLTPVAEVEPVNLGGATVRRATLNNWDDIVRKQVNIYGRVIIRRSNDVIPEIMGGILCNSPDEIVLRPTKPTACPACGAPLKEYGAHMFCTNKISCPAQIIGSLAHYCSKDGMDIEGLSEKTLEMLYSAGFVRELTDLYTLDKFREQLAELSGFGKRKVTALLTAIEKSKTPDLRHFLFALGIPNTGENTTKNLARRFGTLEGVAGATLEDLLAMPDVGDIVAQSIKTFFTDPAAIQMLQTLIAYGVAPKSEAAQAGGILSGMTIVVTGTLPTLGRRDAEELIEKFGGKLGSSVSAKTTFLLAGDNAGSKLEKAKSLGVQVKTEEEFLEMVK